jgi:hypothetical protein
MPLGRGFALSRGCLLWIGVQLHLHGVSSPTGSELFGAVSFVQVPLQLTFVQVQSAGLILWPSASTGMSISDCPGHVNRALQSGLAIPGQLHSICIVEESTA